MRYDVEISHQITVPVYLCIGGYYPTLIYSVPPVVHGSNTPRMRPLYHRLDTICQCSIVFALYIGTLEL